MLKDIKVEIQEYGIHVKVDPVGVKGEKGEKGDPFVYEDFTADQLSALQGPPGDIEFLTTDRSLYKNGNEIRANVSTYKQQWLYGSSSNFTFDFEPTNILQVMINRGGSAVFPEWIFTTPDQLSIASQLQAGDQITAIYEHFIIQP